jgi:hypothetical protein
MNPANLLKIAYLANILILVPTCWSMFSVPGGQRVFEGVVDGSLGLRLLVASLWTAILIASIGGLLYPRFFAPLLLVQIVYKALWLGVFVAPLLLKPEVRWPSGIAICFALIVLIYPFLFWFGYVKDAVHTAPVMSLS